MVSGEEDPHKVAGRTIAVVGSVALGQLFPDLQRRVKDLDLVVTQEAFDILLAELDTRLTKIHAHPSTDKYTLKTKDLVLEVEIVPLEEGGLFQTQAVTWGGTPVSALIEGSSLTWEAATAPTLCALKDSHRYFPIHWHKTMQDIHALWARGVSSDPALLAVRRAGVEARCRTSAVVLAQTNEEFFAKSEGAIQRTYVHDDLHRATCFGDQPVFEGLKPDPAKAYVSRKRFEALPLLQQQRCVWEECYAIALERYGITAWQQTGVFPDAAEMALKALTRLGTTMTAGWFRDFIHQQYPALVREMPLHYPTDFTKAVAEGRVVAKTSVEAPEMGV
jgi:hypothetical protein